MPSSNPRLSALSALLTLLALQACGSDEPTPEPTEACAPEQTWEAVATPFLAAYCQSCHAQATAAQLGGTHVFESEAQVREHGHAMYELVESGMMPLSGPKPPPAEKAAFLEWLRCSGAADSGEHGH